MKPVFYSLLLSLALFSCTKGTRPRYIEHNCCNSATTQWVLVQSDNDTAPPSYFFLPQVFAPGTEDDNKYFKSAESGIANYDITISLDDEVIWLYEGPGPILWDGNIAATQLSAQSGVYNYNLTATFTNGEVRTLTNQKFCLLRQFSACPETVDSCVLRTMFDINDTTLPKQYIKEEALLSTSLFKRCREK